MACTALSPTPSRLPPGNAGPVLPLEEVPLVWRTLMEVTGCPGSWLWQSRFCAHLPSRLFQKRSGGPIVHPRIPKGGSPASQAPRMGTRGGLCAAAPAPIRGPPAVRSAP